MKMDYLHVFFAANGFGPWPCFFCEHEVCVDDQDMKTRLHVHHEDGNRENNKPTNLKPSHASCHMTYTVKNDHPKGFLGKKHSDETKTKIGDFSSRLSRSLEWRAKIGEGRRQYLATQEYRHGWRP